ncbi:hypothetical protein IscW_ISCW006584, partial [Ixodes scapularis]
VSLATGRPKTTQASDVCFLGGKGKASMVTPPRKFIQLKKSSAGKSADKEAEQGS